MRLFWGLLFWAILAMPQWCLAQAAEDGRLKLPQFSLSAQDLAKPNEGESTLSPQKEYYWKGWLEFGPNLLRDQKTIWTFPLSLARGKHVSPTLTVSTITTGFIALDPVSGHYFQDNNSFDDFNRVFSGRNTAWATILTPVAFYGISLIRGNKYDQRTFLLAGEATIGSAILTTVMKDITRRLYPREVPPNGDFSHTWFKKDWRDWRGGIGAFPSGHTSAAFTVATVFAKRYPNHRWVRWVAYGLATLVGFSRITLESHYPSDVFLGAVLGYAIGSHAVKSRP
jgi:membrane-associated phospholipid phosphatase